MENYKRNPFKFLFYFILFVFVSTYLTSYFGQNLFYDELKTRYLGDITNFSRPEFDWIFLGTSRTLTSINPIALENILLKENKISINAGNLGLQHSSRYIDYKILNLYLKKNIKPPKKIFIEINNLDRREIPVPNYPKFSDIFTVFHNIMFQLYKFSNFTVTCYIESFYHGPQDIFNLLFDRLNIYPDLTEFCKNKGFLAMKSVYDFSKETDSNENNQLYANIKSNKHLKYILHYTNKILELCKKNNIIEIYFVFIPAYNEYDLSQEQKEFYSQFGKIIYPDKTIYNEKNYRDPTHLNLEGSKILTQSIYDFIKK